MVLTKIIKIFIFCSSSSKEESTTDTYHEPVNSNLYANNIFFWKIYLNIILSSHMLSLPFRFNYYNFVTAFIYSMRATCVAIPHVLSINRNNNMRQSSEVPQDTALSVLYPPHLNLTNVTTVTVL